MTASGSKDPARGQRVRALREKLGKTADEVAKQVGVSTRGYQNWEEGKTIRRKNLRRLAEALSSTPMYIDPESAVVGPPQIQSDVADRLNRQREILRRVAAQELLTAEQLEELERVLDELEHPPPGGGAESAAEDEEEAA